MREIAAHQRLESSGALAASRARIESARVGTFGLRSRSKFPMGQAASMILQQQGASSRSALGSGPGSSHSNHWGDSVLLSASPVRFKPSVGK